MVPQSIFRKKFLTSVICCVKQSIIRIAMIDVTPIVGLENNFRGSHQMD